MKENEDVSSGETFAELTNFVSWQSKCYANSGTANVSSLHTTLCYPLLCVLRHLHPPSFPEPI